MANCAIDIFDMASDVKAMLEPEIKVPLREVLAGIFDWLGCYIHKKQHWTGKRPPSVEAWCESMDFKYVKGGVHDKIDAYLTMTMNDLLIDIFPGRTWRIVETRKIGPSSLVIEIGQDYRILDWMEKFGPDHHTHDPLEV